MEKFITALQKGMIFTAGILSTLVTFYADYFEKDTKIFIIMLCSSIFCFTTYEMIGERRTNMEYDFDFENEIKNLGSCVEFSELNTEDFDYLENSNWINKEEDYVNQY